MITLHQLLVLIIALGFLFLIFQLVYGSRLRWLHNPEPLPLIIFYVALHIGATITYGLMWFCEWINFSVGTFIFGVVTTVTVFLASTWWMLFIRIAESLKNPPFKPEAQK